MNAWYIPPSNFIGNMREADRQKFLSLCHKRHFSKGDYVFRAGAPGENVYVLEEGRAKIYKISSSGKEVILWFCLPGELFGLSEASRGGPREVYAQVCSDAEIRCISRARFLGFLTEHPDSAMQIIDTLSCRTRILGDTLLNLVTDDVTSRVVKLLVRLGACYGQRIESACYVKIPFTHRDIAEMVGASRQTVSTILNELERAGVLQVNRRQICIPAEDALQRFISMTTRSARKQASFAEG